MQPFVLVCCVGVVVVGVTLQLTKEEKPNDWLLTPPKTQHHRLFPLTPFPKK